MHSRLYLAVSGSLPMSFWVSSYHRTPVDRLPTLLPPTGCSLCYLVSPTMGANRVLLLICGKPGS